MDRTVAHTVSQWRYTRPAS